MLLSEPDRYIPNTKFVPKKSYLPTKLIEHIFSAKAENKLHPLS